MIRRTSIRTLAALIGAVLLATPLWAQTALTSTTLGAAVTDTSGQLVTVASATGITAPGTGSALVLLIIDREILAVRTVSGTSIGVARGQNGSRSATHINGTTVWIAPPAAVYPYIPAGQCTRTTLAYVPFVVGGGVGLGAEVGMLFDCMGVTTAGQWVQTNGNGASVLGSTVASPAGVMTGTGNIFKVSGTNAVTGITAPAGIAPGFTIQIEPTGIFTWTTATNIILAGTAVVGKILYFTWDGVKWCPSYIA